MKEEIEDLTGMQIQFTKIGNSRAVIIPAFLERNGLKLDNSGWHRMKIYKLKNSKGIRIEIFDNLFDESNDGK